ncbi:transcriptional regulator [Prauserella marina]|uniref:DNA-binding transcriptional regulator, HxlR family n=1 Tax=Prauserella marina TaxID=530584 RepID=A0A222VWS8_9PSEU|nr:helix-turn-helix domain-containing protein [Prauserella marina]ASR38282.1 transcriptional regulator [Prauserella marina]PWV78516.1 HxlR family transcriptional regulator [Prauserella marina]SDC87731.1 DNA-binding transcriptional regulator, HxlR family [Prauserella marina]
MSGKRHYGDACGVARALDVLGERWTLLIVRELLLGPKRFTDLRAGLPNASQNVLSHRLRELTENGIVVHRRLGPPARVAGYELTERGRELEPVLFALAGWGSRVPLDEATELSADALMLALRTTFSPRDAQAMTCELRVDGDRFVADVAEGELTISRLPVSMTASPDVVIDTDVATLRSLAFGGRRLGGALRRRTVSLEGERAMAESFLACFQRPAAAS